MKKSEMINEEPILKKSLEELISLALQLGASAAAALPADRIPVEERLAKICKDPGCPGYGKSASCPPHVPGPDGFRNLAESADCALFFKIDVPTPVLHHSSDRLDAFRLLHSIASHVEQQAKEMGFTGSRAFAGGSCKGLFCESERECIVIAAEGECRHPDIARPSMSGHGINVSCIMKDLGWEMERITRDTDPEKVPMGHLCGLVLLIGQ